MASIVCALLAIEMRISVGVNLGTPAMNIIDTMGIGFAMRMQIDVGTYTRDEIRRALAHREPEDGAQRLLRWWKPRLRRRLQTREAGQDPNRKQLLAAPDGGVGPTVRAGSWWMLPVVSPTSRTRFATGQGPERSVLSTLVACRCFFIPMANCCSPAAASLAGRIDNLERYQKLKRTPIMGAQSVLFRNPDARPSVTLE